MLKKHFTFEKVAPKDLLPGADENALLALRLHPLDAELKKHIDEVTVLLEVATGFVKRAQTIDTDGDRMVLSFASVRINTDLADRDLEMAVPPGTTVTRPLEGGK
jgi:outer membrane lipoprotein-sorting protein